MESGRASDRDVAAAVREALRSVYDRCCREQGISVVDMGLTCLAVESADPIRDLRVEPEGLLGPGSWSEERRCYRAEDDTLAKRRTDHAVPLGFGSVLPLKPSRPGTSPSGGRGTP